MVGWRYVHAFCPTLEALRTCLLDVTRRSPLATTAVSAQSASSSLRRVVAVLDGAVRGSSIAGGHVPSLGASSGPGAGGGSGAMAMAPVREVRRITAHALLPTNTAGAAGATNGVRSNSQLGGTAGDAASGSPRAAAAAAAAAEKATDDGVKWMLQRALLTSRPRAKRVVTTLTPTPTLTLTPTPTLP